MARSDFSPERVPVGKVLGMDELGKRLAYALQLPQAYATRLVKAYESVLLDAITHGEGFRVVGIGALKMVRLPPVHNIGFHQGKIRRKIFNFKWTTAPTGREFLNEFSDATTEMERRNEGSG